MSPMNKPTIKELDGLPAGEIDLRIQQSEQRTKEFIETRLTAQDDKLDNMQNDLSALVGTKQITGLVQSVKTTVEGLVEKGTEWHEADLTYRNEMIQRVGKIEEETKRLSGQVQMIRWFVMASHGVMKTIAGCGKLLATEEFWKVFGTGFILYLFAHFAPNLYEHLKYIIAAK